MARDYPGKYVRARPELARPGYLKEHAPQSRSEIKRVFADGDFVILHVHAVRQPSERGQAIMDIFKVSNGKQALGRDPGRARKSREFQRDVLSGHVPAGAAARPRRSASGFRSATGPPEPGVDNPALKQYFDSVRAASEDTLAGQEKPVDDSRTPDE